MLDLDENTLPVEEFITVSLLTPMGNPNDVNCIWGAPLILWGGAGIGKSSRVIAAAKGTGLEAEEIFPAGHHPEDFTGIPVHTKEGGLRRVCALDEVNRLVAHKRGVLFFDEISGATPAVQSALLKVILKRYIGDTQLPGGVRILSAANPPNEAACGWELEPPLANRFIHINVPVPTPSAWGEWLITGEGITVLDRENGEAVIARGWKEEWPRIRGLFKEFVARRGILYALPADGDPARGRAWPSPRTMEYAARLVTTCSILGIGPNGQLDCVRAAIGSGLAAEWLQWFRNADLPTPEEILNERWEPDPSRLDIANAAYASITAYVLAAEGMQQKTYAIKAWNIFGKGCEVGMADVIGYFARLLVRGGLSMASGGKDVAQAARPVLQQLGRQNITSYLPKEA